MFRPHSQTKNKREDLLKNHCWILKKTRRYNNKD